MIRSIYLDSEQPLTIYLGASGRLPSDVEVLLLPHNGGALLSISLDSSSWSDLGDGFYRISLGKGKLLEGVNALIIKDLVGGSRLDYFIWIKGAAPLRKDFWIPLLLESSGTPVQGLLPSALSARYSFAGGGLTFLSLSSLNFREMGEGYYQVFLPASAFLAEGELLLEVKGSSIDPFRYFYYIGRRTESPIYISIKDGVKENVDIYVVDEETQAVVASGQTDIEGNLSLSLPAGKYRVIKKKANYIFTNNNEKLSMPPQYLPPQPAFLLAGNPGPYPLAEGDVFVFKINGGEEQRIEMKSEDFFPPLSLSAVSASFLAAVINKYLHSGKAYHIYIGTKSYLGIISNLVGSNSSVEVVSAPPAMNFPSEIAKGREDSLNDNYLFLDGEAYVPSFPASPTVTMRVRVHDLDGRPVRGAEVVVVNKVVPPVVGGGGLVTNRTLTYFTDANGEVFASLVPGVIVDVIISGMGIVRSGMKVPSNDFDLLNYLGPNDLFDVLRPRYPSLPKA